LPDDGALPSQQLTSFWMNSRHCVPAGMQPGGGAPGVLGVVLLVTMAPITATTTTTTMITITTGATPRWNLRNDGVRMLPAPCFPEYRHAARWRRPRKACPRHEARLPRIRQLAEVSSE
jgi:hypothetical protein